MYQLHHFLRSCESISFQIKYNRTSGQPTCSVVSRPVGRKQSQRMQLLRPSARVRRPKPNGVSMRDILEAAVDGGLISVSRL
jgi:hypothetical protein